ncbi:hypothetical protein HOD30_05270 [Candidatus Peregrinibacteria bacterium]|jgi:SAM-dependent methyltransferase|nr:hypothetical protein [Candidatus Peregrinibacteria bacterium]MBT4631431.1 hypothetical protein [Candidatus Peregrinibacteria bacterium]
MEWDASELRIVCKRFELGAEANNAEQTALIITADGGLKKVMTRSAEKAEVMAYVDGPFESTELRGYDDVHAELRGKYSDKLAIDPYHVERMRVFCERLGLACDGQYALDRIRNLRIVDFGCGGEPPYGNSCERGFQPWLARGMHMLGADITGVDHNYPRYQDGQPKTEEWDFLHANITREADLNIIPNNSVDIVNANALIGYNDDAATSPSLLLQGWARLNDPAYQKAERTICEHALRVLKPEGLFLINNEFIYQKVGGPILFHLKRINGPGLNRIESIQYVDNSIIDWPEA